MPVTDTAPRRLQASLNRQLSEGEREELTALGVLSGTGSLVIIP